jgi:hypothetical protein
MSNKTLAKVIVQPGIPAITGWPTQAAYIEVTQPDGTQAGWSVSVSVCSDVRAGIPGRPYLSIHTRHGPEHIAKVIGHWSKKEKPPWKAGRRPSEKRGWVYYNYPAKKGVAFDENLELIERLVGSIQYETHTDCCGNFYIRRVD